MNQTSTPLHLLTPQEVSALAKIPKPQVYAMAKLVPHAVLRIGRRLRFNRDALIDWLANGGSAEA